MTTTDIQKALITGANGFIGSNLVKHLCELRVEVVALILPGTATDLFNGYELEIVEADITKPQSMLKAFEGVSHVFHLAAIASDWGPELLFEKVNEQGTINVIQAAKANGVKRFVHMSSLSVHQYTGHSNSDEMADLNGNINAYARSKVKCEQYIHGIDKNKLAWTIIRPGMMPYGPGDLLSMPSLIKALKAKQYVHINGGKAKFCTSYVGNLVQGMVLASTHQKAVGETYVLSDDTPVSWREFITKLTRLIGVNNPKMSISYRVVWLITGLMEGVWKLFKFKSSPLLTFYRISVPRKDLVFSNQKAKAQLGFKPVVGLDEGLEKTMDWINNLAKTT